MFDSCRAMDMISFSTRVSLTPVSSFSSARVRTDSTAEPMITLKRTLVCLCDYFNVYVSLSLFFFLFNDYFNYLSHVSYIFNNSP